MSNLLNSDTYISYPVDHFFSGNLNKMLATFPCDLEKQNQATPSQALDVHGFDLIRSDREFTKTNTTKGGGLAIYLNEKWCRNYKIRREICNQNLELLCVSFRPFYLPREFNRVDVFLVYIPPDANAAAAVREVVDTVNAMETASPDSPKIILGDFNH